MSLVQLFSRKSLEFSQSCQAETNRSQHRHATVRGRTRQGTDSIAPNRDNATHSLGRPGVARRVVHSPQKNFSQSTLLSHCRL